MLIRIIQESKYLLKLITEFNLKIIKVSKNQHFFH